MRNLLKVALAVELAMLPACSEPDERAYISALEARIGLLDRRLAAAETRIGVANGVRSATLIVSEKDFGFLPSDVGSLALSVQNVEPYADGSRVSLRVGNTSSATITELGLKLQWGPTGPDGKPDFTASHDGEREFVNILPSSWNMRTINLPGTPPNKLGWIDLRSPDVKGISLRR
jgi:hypothetical protein